MDPLRALRQIGAPLGLPGMPDGRDEQIGAVEIGILDGIGAGIVLEMEEQRPLHRQPSSGSLRHEGFQIGNEVHINPRHPGEMREHLRVLVDLQVVARAVALMGAHDGREGPHLGPAHDELRRADIAEEARIAADIRVVIGVAEEPRRQRARDHRHEPVVAGEIDRLVAAPQQGTMLLDAGEAGAHEEQGLAGLAPALDRAGIHLGPERRPGIVHQLGIDAVGELHVDRQIFAEIGHPAGEAEIEHVLADHALGEPCGSVRIGEIDDAAIELAEIDESRLAALVLCEIAGGLRLREQGAVDGEIGIDVAEEADAAILQLGDALAQARIAVLVRLPVPEQARAERGVAQADPILAPEAGHLRAGRDDASRAARRSWRRPSGR